MHPAKPFFRGITFFSDPGKVAIRPALLPLVPPPSQLSNQRHSQTPKHEN